MGRRNRGHGEERPGSLESQSDQDLIALVQGRARDDPVGGAACELLVRRYEPMVRACAARYSYGPESVEELMQVGYIGLMKAITNFNPEIGGGLDAYARPCVTGEIKRYFRDKRWQLRVHRSAQELRLRIREATGDLTQQLTRRPTDAELAKYLQVSEAELADALLASQAFQVSYLEAPADPAEDDNGTLADLLGEEDDRLEQALTMDAVWQHCAELPDRQQIMLMMRFYGNMTQSEIGRELGMSQMHVSRLLNQSLGYLRDKITDQAV